MITKEQWKEFYPIFQEYEFDSPGEPDPRVWCGDAGPAQLADHHGVAGRRAPIAAGGGRQGGQGPQRPAGRRGERRPVPRAAEVRRSGRRR